MSFLETTGRASGLTIREDTGLWEVLGPCKRQWCTYDESLAEGLLSFFKDENARTLADMGCGWAPYTKYFCENDLFCQGFDGNPYTSENTEGYGRTLDLSTVVRLKPKYDWVLSLEVGEHIPEHCEEVFINNLHENNKRGVVLSWATKGQGGEGHFNEKDVDYIKEKFLKLGYENDNKSELCLRGVSRLDWFKKGVMVFKK
tara:strand:- start:28 stop:630 length:603 start_codon:yes stop_codon:yes gene_type:complete